MFVHYIAKFYNLYSLINNIHICNKNFIVIYTIIFFLDIDPEFNDVKYRISKLFVI